MELLLAGLLEHIVPLLITVISGVLLKIIHGGVKKYGARTDVETQARAEALLSDLVQQGVTYAEQISKGVQDVPGSSKMVKALEYVASELNRNKLPALAEHVLTSKIEAALGFGTLNENHGEPPMLVGEPIEEDDDEDSNIP